MSSLHRQKGRHHWFCAYRSAKDRQHFKSTRTSNKAEAKIIFEKMDRSARPLIESALAEFLDESGQSLSNSGTTDYLNR